jgi:hypothetical protein
LPRLSSFVIHDSSRKGAGRAGIWTRTGSIVLLKLATAPALVGASASASAERTAQHSNASACRHQKSQRADMAARSTATQLTDSRLLPGNAALRAATAVPLKLVSSTQTAEPSRFDPGVCGSPFEGMRQDVGVACSHVLQAQKGVGRGDSLLQRKGWCAHSRPAPATRPETGVCPQRLYLALALMIEDAQHRIGATFQLGGGGCSCRTWTHRNAVDTSRLAAMASGFDTVVTSVARAWPNVTD